MDRVISALPRGTSFTREVIALLRAKGRIFDAELFAHRWDRETPEIAWRIEKAAIAPIGQGDIGASYPAATEFLELLRPLTVLGRLVGMRRVPFGVAVPRQNTGAVVSWVGENKPAPATSLNFDNVTLALTKCAAIVPFSDALILTSSPSIESIVRQDLLAAMSYFADEQLLDPNQAGTPDVAPASLTYGATNFSSTGTSTAQIKADLKLLVRALTTAGANFVRPYWVMHGRVAAHLATLSSDDVACATVTPMGGTFWGIPILTTRAGTSQNDSPESSIVVLLDASEVLYADGGAVRLDASDQASIQMVTNPSEGATTAIALWQMDYRAIKVEQFRNYQMARDGCIAVLDGVTV